tara:strand:+ start:2801 stop:3136 length:336 start_codon:yes stop_codon:yes gene_type:complete
MKKRILGKFTRRVCYNKGFKRCWAEGNILDQMGIKVNMRFNKIVSQGKVSIVFTESGRQKINGTTDRPILDLNGKFLNVLGDATFYEMTFYNTIESNFVDLLEITPTENVA